MKQVAIAVMWGVLEESNGRYPLEKLPQLLEKLKSLGYGGIEIPVAYIMKYGSSKFQALLKEKDMKAVAGMFTSGPPPVPGMLGIASEFGIEHPKDDMENFHNVDRHAAVFRAQVEEVARIKDVFIAITCHTGRDYFTSEEGDALFTKCLAIEKELGVQVNHETHRARILYSPWVVSGYLDRHPDLHLVADYSHYSVVAELGASGEYTQPLQEVIAKCNTRVRHIHARVGFEEGPQIPDPRCPGWDVYFKGYMAWWRGIVKAAAARGQPILSTTPEFGPAHVAGYGWANPYNGDKPVVNIWDVNHWVAQRLAEMMKEEGHEPAMLVEDADKGVWAL